MPLTQRKCIEYLAKIKNISEDIITKEKIGDKLKYKQTITFAELKDLTVGKDIDKFVMVDIFLNLFKNSLAILNICQLKNLTYEEAIVQCAVDFMILYSGKDFIISLDNFLRKLNEFKDIEISIKPSTNINTVEGLFTKTKTVTLVSINYNVELDFIHNYLLLLYNAFVYKIQSNAVPYSKQAIIPEPKEDEILSQLHKLF